MELALDLKATLHNRPVAWEAAEELVTEEEPAEEKEATEE